MQTSKTAQVAEAIASDCAVTRLRKLSRKVTCLYDDALRPLGLKVSQQAVLVAIGAAPDSRVGDVAERLELAPSSMTRSVVALAEKGWVAVTPEGREARVRLTEKGEHLLKESHTPWQRAQAQVAELIDESGLLEGLNNAVQRTRVSE